ncbi:MAG: hypothetical protein JSS34_01595 [Proteobacteria bacterium]|nr:hypothetical protein [Pseudomonadota bacterium]
MHFKKVIILSLFYLVCHPVLSMMLPDDEDQRNLSHEKTLRQEVKNKLNTQTGENLYTDDYIFISEPLSGPHNPPPIPNSILYSLESIRQNGISFTQETDNDGNVLWKHPERPTDLIFEDSILSNFRGLDFLNSRTHKISREQYASLQRNSGFHLEERENSFFRHDPFLLKVKSTLTPCVQTVHALQKGVFLRGHAPSLSSYEDLARFSQNRFSFRTILSIPGSHEPLEIDLVGRINPHVGYNVSLNMPEEEDDDYDPNTLYLKPEKNALVLTFQGPAGTLITENIPKDKLPFNFKITSPESHFKTFLPELLKITSRKRSTHHMLFNPLRYVYAFNSHTQQIDVFVLTLLAPPFKEQLVKIEASSTLSFTKDDLAEEEEDWTLIDNKTEEPLLAEAAAAASAHPHHPLPDHTTFPAQPLFSHSFNTRKNTSPGLLYFSHSIHPEDASSHQKEETFHRTISSLKQSAALLEEGPQKKKLLEHVEQHVSRFILQSHASQRLFSQFMPDSPGSHVEGEVQKAEQREFSINAQWKEQWGFQEKNAQKYFDDFLRSCLELCSQKTLLHSPLTFPQHRPHFQGSIPPQGYYIEKEETEGIYTWTPFITEAKAVSHKIFHVRYNHTLCFGTFSLESIPASDVSYQIREMERLENFKEVPFPISSVILNNMSLSSKAEDSLLVLLKSSDSLSSLSFMGCTFNAGFLQRLLEVLGQKNMTHLDLTQSFFPESMIDHQDPSLHFNSLLEAFIGKHPALTHLTYSDIMGVSLQIIKKGRNLFTRSFYGEDFEVNCNNLPFLRRLIGHKSLSSIRKFKAQNMPFREGVEASESPMAPLEFIGLLATLTPELAHLESLSVINCFEQGLPPEFFDFVPMTSLQALDLSGTPLFPKDGNFSYLNLGSSTPQLKTLVLRKCFQSSNPLNTALLFPEFRNLPLTKLDLSANDFYSESNASSFRALPFSLEALYLPEFRTFPYDIADEVLRGRSNLRHFSLKFPFSSEESVKARPSYNDFIKKMKAFGPSVLFLETEISSPLRSVYERVFLDLTGLVDEHIILNPLNLSLALDPHAVNPEYQFNFVHEDTDFEILALSPKNLYLKAYRGIIHYAVLGPDGERKIGNIPFEVVRRNFTGGLIGMADVQDSLHHIFRVLYINNHIPSPRSVEFRMISARDMEGVCRSLRDKFKGVQHLGFTTRCFQTPQSFVHTCQSLRGSSLEYLEDIDFSDNNFEVLFSSHEHPYEKFKESLLSLFHTLSSLTKISFTDKDGKRIEWVKIQRSNDTEPIMPSPFEFPTSPAEHPYRLFINPAAAPENTKMFSNENIFFFPSIINYMHLQHIIFQDVFMNAPTRSLILGDLKSAQFNKSLTFSRCFTDVSSKLLIPFFKELATLPLQSLHIEDVFGQNTFHTLASILATSSTLRELSIDLPNRNNHKLVRSIVGTTLGAGLGAAAAIYTGGLAVIPIVIGSTGGGLAGGTSGGASGPVINKIKASWDIPSRQAYEELVPFMKSPNLVRLNVGNYTRSEKSHASMQKMLEKETGGRIQFRFFAPR